MSRMFGYGYDAAGNLRYRTNNALVETFTADAVNQLSNVTRTGTLTIAGTTGASATSVLVGQDGWPPSAAATRYPDGAFALAGVTPTYSAGDYIGVSASDSLGRTDATGSKWFPMYNPATFLYDQNGNLTSDGLYGYSYENQLTAITATNSWTSVFTFDGRNRLRIRVESNFVSSAWIKTSETRYIYDGMLCIQERDANNYPLVTYTRGKDLSGSRAGAGGIGGLLARTENALYVVGQPGAHAYYHADGNGNVTAMVNDKQLVVAKYSYDPYGNTLSLSGPLADANSYRFSSKEIHRNSGLYYYGYRFYNPNLQRWMNRDPIQEKGGWNLYGFVFNNPLTAFDLWGLLTRAQCSALRGQIFRKAAALLDDLQRYDPVEDGKGGHLMFGSKRTKPGGHFREIGQRQAGLKNDIASYVQGCVKCPDDKDPPPNPPIPQRIDDMASRPVQPPVLQFIDSWSINPTGAMVGLGLATGTVGAVGAVGAGAIGDISLVPGLVAP